MLRVESTATSPQRAKRWHISLKIKYKLIEKISDDGKFPPYKSFLHRSRSPDAVAPSSATVTNHRKALRRGHFQKPFHFPLTNPKQEHDKQADPFKKRLSSNRITVSICGSKSIRTHERRPPHP